MANNAHYHQPCWFRAARWRSCQCGGDLTLPRTQVRVTFSASTFALFRHLELDSNGAALIVLIVHPRNRGVVTDGSKLVTYPGEGFRDLSPLTRLQAPPHWHRPWLQSLQCAVSNRRVRTAVIFHRGNHLPSANSRSWDERRARQPSCYSPQRVADGLAVERRDSLVR